MGISSSSVQWLGMYTDAFWTRDYGPWQIYLNGERQIVDMYYYPDVIAEVVESCGMRALISATVIDQTSPDAADAEDSLAKGVAFIKRWKDRNARITPILGPHATYTLDATQLRAVRDTAMAMDVPISIHLSESSYEIEYAKQNYGMSSIELLDSINFFDVPIIGAPVV